MNFSCVIFSVLLCLMNTKAEEIAAILNVIDFTITLAIKRDHTLSQHIYKGSVIISQILFLP